MLLLIVALQFTVWLDFGNFITFNWKFLTQNHTTAFGHFSLLKHSEISLENLCCGLRFLRVHSGAIPKPYRHVFGFSESELDVDERSCPLPLSL